MKTEKLKVGIFGFTGCAGCQLSILNCEQELVDIFQSTDIRSFLMASSGHDECRLDIAFIEGSVSTEKDRMELIDIRERADLIVAIGICACVGGIQAAFLDQEEWKKQYEEVYGKVKMSHTAPLQSKPLDAYVKVDHYLPGCPISREQFLPTLTRLIGLNPPELSRFPVCVECKWRENDCLLNRGISCLGPITAAGCSAVCPSHTLPCVGCWGPAHEPNGEALFRLIVEKGLHVDHVRHKMAIFSGNRIGQLMQRFGHQPIKEEQHASH